MIAPGRLVQHNGMHCAQCHGAVRAGDAVIRSVAFRQVAWHRDCFAAATDSGV